MTCGVFVLDKLDPSSPILEGYTSIQQRMKGDRYEGVQYGSTLCLSFSFAFQDASRNSVVYRALHLLRDELIQIIELCTSEHSSLLASPGLHHHSSPYSTKAIVTISLEDYARLSTRLSTLDVEQGSPYRKGEVQLLLWLSFVIAYA